MNHDFDIQLSIDIFKFLSVLIFQELFRNIKCCSLCLTVLELCQREKGKLVLKKKKKKPAQMRRQQDSNLRRQSPTDFESVSLTTRTYRQLLESYLNVYIYAMLQNYFNILKSYFQGLHYFDTYNTTTTTVLPLYRELGSE